MLAAPVIAGATANQPTFDFAPIEPFAAMTITDPDTEAMFARVTISNGVNRGDFTPFSTPGWLRTVNGSDIVYTRSFNPTANIGQVVQDRVRTLDFQPRVNAIPGGTRESTAFTVFVYDQTTADTDHGTSVRVTSVNDPPVVGAAISNQAILDAQTILPFASMTVTDADTQAANTSVTIDNGVNRGDFTPASRTGWTRVVNGFDIVYTRSFGVTTNIGDAVQSSVRSLVFQPRENAIRVNTSETTLFKVRVGDGLASSTNTATTVVTTSRNEVPSWSGGEGLQPINSNQTIHPFNEHELADRDYQDMFVTVTIQDGTLRGDFTPASTIGWTRTVAGNEIRYQRYFPVGANVGSRALTALRGLVFQARSGIIVGAQEDSKITATANDGISAASEVTYIRTTGV